MFTVDPEEGAGEKKIELKYRDKSDLQSMSENRICPKTEFVRKPYKI